MKSLTEYIVLMCLTLMSITCKKENITEPVEQGSLVIQLTHVVKEQPLVFDTLAYINNAGNVYSVSKLHYYISAIRLYTADYKHVFQSNGVYYISARNTNSSIYFPEIPKGNYQFISFDIGIDTLQNISNSLPMNMENMEMVWPDEMGGGYHFLKLEGRYLNSSQLSRGYAIHTGTHMALTKHQPIFCNLNIVNKQESTISISMDVNSWFDSPIDYDIQKQGNYTMGINDLMLMIANNGRDVFNKN